MKYILFLEGAHIYHIFGMKYIPLPCELVMDIPYIVGWSMYHIFCDGVYIIFWSWVYFLPWSTYKFFCWNIYHIFSMQCMPYFL